MLFILPLPVAQAGTDTPILELPVSLHWINSVLARVHTDTLQVREHPHSLGYMGHNPEVAHQAVVAFHTFSVSFVGFQRLVFLLLVSSLRALSLPREFRINIILITRTNL